MSASSVFQATNAPTKKRYVLLEVNLHEYQKKTISWWVLCRVRVVPEKPWKSSITILLSSPKALTFLNESSYYFIKFACSQQPVMTSVMFRLYYILVSLILFPHSSLVSGVIFSRNLTSYIEVKDIVINIFRHLYSEHDDSC